MIFFCLPVLNRFRSNVCGKTSCFKKLSLIILEVVDVIHLEVSVARKGMLVMTTYLTLLMTKTFSACWVGFCVANHFRIDCKSLVFNKSFNPNFRSVVKTPICASERGVLFWNSNRDENAVKQICELVKF